MEARQCFVLQPSLSQCKNFQVLSRLPTAARKKFKQSYFEQNPIPRPRMLLSYSHRFPFKALRCKPHMFYAFRL